ncbi:SCO2322 family protein [Streptomyces sp. WI04-05B]|uniref:SCO2322 family protein n=1 Tax=Streptomyces TaxID=1883 RepID=UPI0029B1704D|nr:MULTISPECIES: SCO2322 family protein [unclassified Streptomyces]MDX2540602.1 SCO2322 family protein [Streptomyces sp. WI04-05B]MDX2584966.1 SCO2322 family protein [Streptomyces sp. WI04-05A]MDX3749234.1 SCO2322 family protein [Streptomyces sp. AK08-02]
MIRRRALPLLVAALLLGLWASAGQAQAVGYRYWSFWERDGGAWTYATQGPSTARPSDGDVQGFRFAVSQDSKDAARPRADAVFAVVCARTPAQDGHKRVALVIDFGTPADAPSGESPPATRTACARVSPDATTADALASVAGPLRYDASALLCAITGYPRTGCGETVGAGKSAGATDTDSDGGPSVGLLAGIAAVVALGGAAIWQTRRRRHA